MHRMSPSYALGLLFILLVSIIWALASVLVQWMYTEKSFDSPFLLTYIGVSLFTLLLPNHFLSELCQGRTPMLLLSLSPSRRHEQRSGAYETISIEATEVSPPSSSESQSRTVSSWTVEDHCWAAAKIAPVWFVSNWSYNSSLKYTSITSSTVLSSTGSLFTFLFAVVLRDESFTMLKLSGVLLGMSGSILTAFHDIDARQDDNEPEQEDLSDTLLTHTGDENYKTLGDSLGLLSAVGYGAYTVMVRVLLPRQEHMFSMQVFLGFVGLFNCLALSPIMIWEVYHSSDLSLAVFSFVCLKGLLDNVLSDYLWARAVLLTSATVATVGVGLTIPMAFLSDWIMGHPDVVDPSSIIGALAVLVGFVLVNLSTANSETEVRTGINENDLIDNELGVGVDGSISDQHDNPNVRGDGMSEVSLRPIRGRSRNRSLAPEEP